MIRKREKAAEFPFIQHNRSNLKHWLVFDVDRPDAFFGPEEAGLPAPTFTAINRLNGHAHIAYQLETPVSFYDSSRLPPMRFYDAVGRGMTKRLEADQGYRGFISKNPLSSFWETVWQASAPYALARLNDYLEPDDKRWRQPEESPLGRNVTVFDAIREIAYREVLKFKKRGDSEEVFREFLSREADSINHTFHPAMLHNSEIRCLAKSVSRYTWRKFTVERFSAIQAARGKRRWSKTVTVESQAPWKEQGISRRTYYARKAALI